MLTDSSGEYEVSVVKYMYKGYITFQFEIKNLLPNLVVKDVSVALTINDPILQFVSEVKASSISHKETGYSYVILSYNSESKPFPVTTFQAKMLFTIVEFDPSTNTEEGSYEDEYILPDVTLSAKDFVTGKALNETEFK
jgi:coatomer protein complex subunit gamma